MGWIGQHERHAALRADLVALGAVVGEELRGADLVDRPLEARLGLVVAVADAVEHAHQCVGRLEHLGRGHELVDDERAAAKRRQPAAGDELEPALGFVIS